MGVLPASGQSSSTAGEEGSEGLRSQGRQERESEPGEGLMGTPGQQVRYVYTRVGRSVHGTAPLFFSWSTAQIYSWAVLGGRGTGKAAPKPCRFFLDLPRSLVVPALRHNLPTKRHKAACGFCFRHPVGTLNSRGLWSRGQHRPHKIRRGTSRKGLLVYFW